MSSSTRAADERGHWRWLVRLRGDEKDVVATWLTLRQRTVHVETEVTPAPQENHEALYRYLLIKNAELHGVHLALGWGSAYRRRPRSE